VRREPTRDRLAADLQAARRETDVLFDWLTPDAMLSRPIAERHRLVFYLGHLAAFDWNLIVRDCLRAAPRREDFERLFAFGIDPIDGDLPRDTASDWPAVPAIRQWVAATRADIDEAVATAPLTGWLTDAWAARLAVEHRLMHAETLAYLLHRLPPSALVPRALPQYGDAPAAPATWIDVPAGRATLGRPRSDDPHGGWDNEYGEHRVDVPAFRVSSRKVTNGDWLRFVEAGGYRDDALWSDDDRAWRDRDRVEHPAFWARRDGRWWLRAMFGEVPLPPATPVYVSHAEASAYARWQGAALPTEAQWHRAAYAAPDGREHPYPWGHAAPVPGVHGNFGFAHVDPTPVGAHPAGRSALGVDEMIGNGWEWTRSPFAPFEGFTPLPFYKGYSANFFDGRHFVLKGASPRTATCFTRRSFRNWFQPHYPHVYATLRCVDDGRPA
jgi:gamma-glutamyl hercynylcysteine S-oxide synthase